MNKAAGSADVTLRQLRAFIAVLDGGSFSQAATSMHVSQAALSGLVRELEGRLGVRLLERTTRSVTASVVGQSFEPLVRRVLDSLNEALEGVTNLKELRRGLVRVAAPEPLSCTLLPELMESFGRQYPGIDLRFDDVPIEQVLAGLHNGSIDIGVGPAGVLHDETMETYPLRTEPLWAALRRDDPLARADAVLWKDLRDRTLINYMPNLATNVLAHVPPRHHPQAVMAVHRVNTALSLLRVRQGFAICPAIARPLVEGFGLAFLPLRQPLVTWHVGLFARQRAALTPAVESFLDFTLKAGNTQAIINPKL